MPRKKAPGRSTRKAQSTPPGLPDRRLMERHMAAVGRLLGRQQFASIDEANAAINALLAQGDLPSVTLETPLDQAQELVYRAMEATGPRRQRLAQQALALSPECVDAYVLLAESTTDSAEALRLYELGVQAGERALGPEVFAEEAGHFWGLLETRPYMRAREGLAEVLWVLGDRPAAIAHLWALLELNPNDNQGVRDILANWLLTVDDAAGVDRLLDRYPDEASAQWAFTKALQLFRCEGAGSEAEAALREALEVNPFVVLYLLGAKQLPRQLPPYVGLGDENEAVSYVAAAGELWLTTPGAFEWFVSVMQGVIATKKRPTLVHRRHARRGSSGPTGREGTE